jgi:hypothetical protein
MPHHRVSRFSVSLILFPPVAACRPNSGLPQYVRPFSCFHRYFTQENLPIKIPDALNNERFATINLLSAVKSIRETTYVTPIVRKANPCIRKLTRSMVDTWALTPVRVALKSLFAKQLVAIVHCRMSSASERGAVLLVCRVREAKPSSKGAFRTETGLICKSPFRNTASRNAPFRQQTVLHAPYGVSSQARLHIQDEKPGSSPRRQRKCLMAKHFLPRFGHWLLIRPLMIRTTFRDSSYLLVNITSKRFDVSQTSTVPAENKVVHCNSPRDRAFTNRGNFVAKLDENCPATASGGAVFART